LLDAMHLHALDKLICVYHKTKRFYEVVLQPRVSRVVVCSLA